MNLLMRFSVFFILSVTAPLAAAVDCDVIWPDGLNSSHNNGAITFGWQSELSGSDGLLDTRNLNGVPGAGNTCNPLDCAKTNNTVPQQSFNSFPNNSNDIVVGFQGTGNYAPGNYRNISLGSQATLVLDPGDYYIRGNINLNNLNVIRLSQPGTVRFYTRRAISFASQTQVNPEAGDRYFFLYSRENITLAANTTFNGLIYGRRNVSLQNQAVVNGAITSERTITLGSASYTNFDMSRVTGGDLGGFCTNPLPATLVAEWRLEEALWSGAANEVIDYSGNGLNGRSISYNGAHPSTENTNPAIAGDPGTCRYGKFDGTSDGHVRIEDNPLLDLDTALTVTAWINPASFPTGGNLQTIASKDENWEFHTTSAREIFWWWGGGAQELTTSGANLQAGTWYHLAITYQSGTQKIYVNGIERASSSTTGNLTLNNDPVFIGTDLAFNSRNFNGLIDEVRVYSGAMSAVDVNAVMAETHPCPFSGPDHYAVSLDGATYNDGTRIICEASSVWIEAHDAAHGLVAPGSGVQIALSTSTGQGYWSAPSVGTLVDQGGGNALYTFANNDRVELKFNHPVAAAVSFNIDANPPQENPTLTFVETLFRFLDQTMTPGIPNQVAGLNSNTVYLQAIRASDNSASCVGVYPSGVDVALEMAAECNNPLTCAGRQLSVSNNGNTTALATLDDDGGGGVSGYTPITLRFGANSAAALNLNYPDVGLLSLHARDELLNNSGGSYTPARYMGSSPAAFVVKPYSLVVNSVPSNPATTSAGNGFVAAGEAFTVQVEAREAGGSRTPNYGNEISPEGILLEVESLIYPAGGSTGALNNAASFSAIAPAGRFENTAVNWSEVGTVHLQARIGDGDYLGSGDLASGDGSVLTPTGDVGRFYPDHFVLTGDTLEDACVAGDFSYMSEPLTLAYTLEAMSALNSVTSNYDVANLNWQTPATVNYQAEDSDSGIELNVGGRVVVNTPDWNAGQLVVNDSSANFARNGGVNPEDGPYWNLAIGVELTDSLDSRQLQGLDMDSGSSGACGASCTAKQLGNPLRALFGRLHLKDAFGPESADIPMFWQTEFWNGSAFVINTLDSCTSLALADVSFDGAAAVDTLANTITVTKAGVSSAFQFWDLDNPGAGDQLTFSAGEAGSVYGAPSPTATVIYRIDIDLLSRLWLSGDWDQQNGYDDTAHPPVFVNFQQYRGSDRVIYWREIFK